MFDHGGKNSSCCAWCDPQNVHLDVLFGGNLTDEELIGFTNLRERGEVRIIGPSETLNRKFGLSEKQGYWSVSVKWQGRKVWKRGVLGPQDKILRALR